MVIVCLILAPFPSCDLLKLNVRSFARNLKVQTLYKQQRYRFHADKMFHKRGTKRAWRIRFPITEKNPERMRKSVCILNLYPRYGYLTQSLTEFRDWCSWLQGPRGVANPFSIDVLTSLSSLQQQPYSQSVSVAKQSLNSVSVQYRSINIAWRIWNPSNVCIFFQ